MAPIWAQSPNPVDMPPGYLMPAPRLEEFRRQEAVSEMRSHAWNLFRGANRLVRPQFDIQLDKVPIWITWNTKDEAFTGKPIPFFQRFEVPIQIQALASMSTLTDRAAAEGQPLSTVYLSPQLARQLRTPKAPAAAPSMLVTAIRPDTIKAADDYFTKYGITGTAREIAPFPDASIAVKTAWWFVSSKAWRVQPIPVWRGPKANPDASLRKDPLNWSDPVHIDPTKARHRCKKPPEVCPDFPQPDGGTPDHRPVVPIDRFFYVPVCTCDEAYMLKDKFKLAGILPGDYVLLMGMHIATREIPDWVWATFWWSDTPNAGEFSTNRPPFYPKPWRNYVMDTTLDMVTPRKQGQPKATYNPWLEVVIDGAVTDNCMSCHRSAAYPRVASPAHNGFVDPDGPELRNRTKLDFLWTIADQFEDANSPLAPTAASAKSKK